MENTINDADVPYVKAYTNGNTLSLRNSVGADIILDGDIWSYFDVSDILPHKVEGKAWVPLQYTASSTIPTTAPANGTLWYNPDFKVDILVNSGGWVDFSSAYPHNDIMLLGSAPTSQSDGTSLLDGDLWINTADMENYPRIYRYRNSSWGLIDNSDQTTPRGIVFADARSDIESTELDSDAPDFRLYPNGVHAFQYQV